MSADKYLSIFSRQMEAIVYLSRIIIIEAHHRIISEVNEIVQACEFNDLFRQESTNTRRPC